jgi:hypothetical protein
MSFDLFVSFEQLPSDLARVWTEGFRRHGFEVEVMPGFDPSTWEGGFLPCRVLAAPEELVGITLPDPGVSGFELSFEKKEAYFRSASGRPTTEFAMQCLGAALLAEATGGSYDDPQAGKKYRGAAAIDAALDEIRMFVPTARPHERVHHSFPGWAELGVTI